MGIMLVLVPHAFQNPRRGTSLAVQWLRLHAPSAGSTGSVPGRGTKIPHAAWCGQKKTWRQHGGTKMDTLHIVGLHFNWNLPLLQWLVSKPALCLGEDVTLSLEPVDCKLNSEKWLAKSSQGLALLAYPKGMFRDAQAHHCSFQQVVQGWDGSSAQYGHLGPRLPLTCCFIICRVWPKVHLAKEICHHVHN